MSAVEIRCDTSYIFVKDIPFTEINSAKSARDNYQDLENKLPYVSEFQEIKDDGWAHRMIVDVATKTRGGSVKEWQERSYLLYVCMGERAGLPHNETVECILTVYGDGTRPFHLKAFGDAFVFATKPESKAVGSGPAEFKNMSLIFVMEEGARP